MREEFPVNSQKGEHQNVLKHVKLFVLSRAGLSSSSSYQVGDEEGPQTGRTGVWSRIPPPQLDSPRVPSHYYF